MNSSEGNFSGSSTDDDALQVVVYILSRVNFWCLALIILIGLTGNTLSIIIIWNTKLRRVTSNHYLLALSTSDSVFLLALFMIWLSKLQLPLYHEDGPCHVVNFSLNCSSWLSSWYITVMTVERYIVVYFPLSPAARCTVSRTKLIICLLVPLPIVFNVWVLFALGINDNGVCDIMRSYYHVGLVLNAVDTLVTFVMPTIIIVTCNTAICVKMCSKQEKFKASNCSSNTSSSMASATTCMLAEDRGTMRRHTGVAMAQKMQKQERKITQSLLVVSFVFLALNLPSYSFRVRDYFLATAHNQPLKPTATELVVQNVFSLIYYSNFAINFFVYSLSSANFRKTAVALLQNQPLIKRLSSTGSRSKTGSG